MNQPLPRRRHDVFSDALPDGSMVLYDLRAGMIYALSVVAGYIWNACDGSRPLAALADELVGMFEVDRVTASRDIAALLEQLQRLDVLEANSAGQG